MIRMNTMTLIFNEADKKQHLGVIDSSPLILVLENRKSQFGVSLHKDLKPVFRVLSFKNIYMVMSRIKKIYQKNEPLKAMIIYRTLPLWSFLQLWQFIVSKKRFENTPIYYYHEHVLYCVKGNRKIFTYPLNKIDDLELQLGIILDSINITASVA